MTLDATRPEREYNLRTEPWIPVRYANPSTGETHGLLGLEELFNRAHQISDLDIADPFELYGMRKFLASVMALVAREQELTPRSARRAATDGLDSVAVANVMDTLSERLWLVHPTAPFMQEPGYFSIDHATAKPITAIQPGVPGPESKAWHGRRAIASRYTPAKAARALIAHWAAATATNRGAKLPNEDLVVASELGSILYASRDALRFWFLESNLAKTLLANTPLVWVDSHALPGWAQTWSAIVPETDFEKSTISGNGALLIAAPGSELVFESVIAGGAIRDGIPLTKEEKKARELLGKERKRALNENKKILAFNKANPDADPVPNLPVPELEDAIATFKLVLRDAAKIDPWIVRTSSGHNARPLAPGMTSLHIFSAWFAEYHAPQLPSSEFMLRGSKEAEFFSVAMRQQPGGLSVFAFASWSPSPEFVFAGEAERESLIDFASRVESRLRKPIVSALGKFSPGGNTAKAKEATADEIFKIFALRANELLDRLLLAAASGNYDPQDTQRIRMWGAGVLDAYESYMHQFANATTIPAIAAGKTVLLKSLFGKPTTKKEDA